MSGFLEEFKAFALKGNVVDLAVGVVIGGAFGKIVSSLVNDLVMPLLGLLVGGSHFGSLNLVLREASGETPALTLNYGSFLQSTFDFLIISMAIFIMIKFLSKFKRAEEAPAEAPAVTPEDVTLLREIRDLLKK